MPFADYFQKLVSTSFRRTWGGLYAKGLGEAIDGSADGVVRDEAGNAMTSHIDATGLLQSGAPAADYGIVARVRAAVKARFPDTPLGATTTPDDALNAIGSERELERGIASSQNFATKLRQAWSTWLFGGTPYGLLRELWTLGYTNVHVVIVNGLAYTMQSNTGVPGDGTTGQPTSGDLVISQLMPQSWWPSPGSSPARRWWTRFAVIFDAPLPTAPSNWQVALPASNSDEVNAIRRVIARWKPGFAICDRIIVLSSGNAWGYPTSLRWGQVNLKWGGNTVTYWTP